QDLGGRRPAQLGGYEQGHEGEAAHVGAHGLGGVPGGPGEVEEDARGHQPALDRVEDLLLVGLAGEVVGGRVARVLTRAGQGQGLDPGELVGPRVQVQRPAAVRRPAGDLRADPPGLDGDAADGVDEVREVGQVDDDDVVDLD